MEAAWRHTDTLIFQSRYQEILLLVQDDPLEDMMRVSMRREGGGGGLLIVMHGRSPMTIDPRISVECRDGARRASTEQADIYFAPSAKRHKVFDE